MSVPLNEQGKPLLTSTRFVSGEEKYGGDVIYLATNYDGKDDSTIDLEQLQTIINNQSANDFESSYS